MAALQNVPQLLPQVSITDAELKRIKSRVEIPRRSAKFRKAPRSETRAFIATYYLNLGNALRPAYFAR